MTETKLTPEETLVLKTILAKLVIKSRTGEIGIMHGADRFVSSQLVFKTPERELLTLIRKKLELESIAEVK